MRECPGRSPATLNPPGFTGYPQPMRKERRSRVFLVGFMGSGKSTVGAHLAREIGYRFVDLDQEIEKNRGLSVSEIFERDGESEFRRLESHALKLSGAQQGVVVATGGGTLTRRENRDVMKTGVSVWLDAPLPVMLERCKEGERRPLLSTPERMAALLAERVSGYRDADLRVDSSVATPDVIARRIANLLRNAGFGT